MAINRRNIQKIVTFSHSGHIWRSVTCDMRRHRDITHQKLTDLIIFGTLNPEKI